MRWARLGRAFSQVGGTGGCLYRIRLSSDRRTVDTSADTRLAAKVADNLFRTQKFDGTARASMTAGRGFGTVTDIVQAPGGSLSVVSLTDSAVYGIGKAP